MEVVLIILAAILWISYNSFVRLREEARNKELNLRPADGKQVVKKKRWPSPAGVKVQTNVPIDNGFYGLTYRFTGNFDDTRKYKNGDIVIYNGSDFVWYNDGWVRVC